MITSPYYTKPVTVWTVGQPAPTTPWHKITTDNPICFVVWSYSKWGKKIVKSYL